VGLDGVPAAVEPVPLASDPSFSGLFRLEWREEQVLLLQYSHDAEIYALEKLDPK